MSIRARWILPALFVAIASRAPAQQPEAIDTGMIAKLKAEEADHSKLMWIEHYLTDVYGPRPVGSPNHVAAANWAVKTMTGWGMKNAHLEPFTWRGVGWLPGRATGFITSPVKQNIKFESVPWTPSTKGTVSGEVVSIVAPDTPTEDELVAFLTPFASKVKGGIVMVGLPPNVPVNFNERPKRTPDEDVRARYGPPDPNGGGRGGRGGGGGRGGAATPPPVGHLSAQQVNARITQFLKDNPPALRLTAQGPGRIPGVIVAQNGAGQIYDDTTPQSPAVILRTDDFGRIYRIISDGTPVRVEFNVSNQFFPEGKTSYVTVAEIPGTDKADEVVMLGGHLDSWTSATGATDNAIGCSIMMEAARILLAANAHPRRTIRVALWSGEEEGELGSLWYVKEHFGSAEQPTKDFGKLDAYWNIDDGTGRVRGASVFGPPEAAAVVAQYLKPFEEWGVFGASASSARVEGGSDNGAFDVAGLPGIGANQDNIEYNSTTWHTNLDTYERIVPDDVTHNAVVSAALVLGLANREQMLPRFSPDKMPAVPAGRGGGAGAAPAGPQAMAHVFVTAKGAPLTVKSSLVPTPARGAESTPAITAALAAKPAHGKVVVNANGGFTYTPAAGYSGNDTFSYTLSSGAATSEPGKVTIVVK